MAIFCRVRVDRIATHFPPEKSFHCYASLKGMNVNLVEICATKRILKCCLCCNIFGMKEYKRKWKGFLKLYPFHYCDKYASIRRLSRRAIYHKPHDWSWGGAFLWKFLKRGSSIGTLVPLLELFWRNPYHTWPCLLCCDQSCRLSR